MHTEIRSRKAHGRLSREDQRRLGDILHRLYDDVVKEGVPDRFERLLRQIEEPGRTAKPLGAVGLSADATDNVSAEQAVRASDLDEPHDKGSN